MISKLKNNTPDTGFAMTHKPSKFASSFGTEGSQIVPKKSKMSMYRNRPSPEKLQKPQVEAQHMRVNSNRSKKSSKKNSARQNEAQSNSPAQQEEQKAIQQAQFEEVHADQLAAQEDTSQDETTQNQDQLQVTTNPHSPSKDSSKCFYC